MTAFLSKPVAIVLLIGLLFASAGLSGWKVVSTVSDIIDDRVTAARAERDAHWRAEIERANVAAAQNIIAQMRASRAADLVARAEIDRLKNQVSELERKNADLPDHDGSGIDVDRTRLLNHQPIANHPN